MKFILMLVVVFLLGPLSWNLHAEDKAIEIRGVVKEKGTRNLIKNVNVFLLPEKLKAITNDKGEFSFRSSWSEDCELIINLTGYKKWTQKRPCSEMNQGVIEIYLERFSYTLFETTVTSKVKKRDQLSQSLTQDEFIKTPGSFGGDPVRAAQNLPGVAASGASAQIIVQGASPDDTAYVIDGHQVPLVFHFGGLSSVLIPEVVERVDLLPAGYGPEYSRALGGVVGLTSKKPKKDRFHGMAYIDLLNAGGLVEGPIDETSSFFVSGRYSYIGQVLKAVSSASEDFELTAAPSYYDINSVYKKKINDKHDFKALFVFSKDELELVFNKPLGNDPKLRGGFYNRTEFFRLIPQFTSRLNSRTQMSHSIGLGRDNLFVDIAGRYLDVQANVLSHRSELQYQWFKNYKIYLGLDNYWTQSQVRVNLPTRYSVGGVNTPFSVGEERKFEVQGGDGLLGMYLRQELNLNSKLTIQPNIRVDHFTSTDETILAPRLQLNYQFSPDFKLLASAGKYTQSPRPEEISKNYGNSDLKNPYAYHYVLGWSKSFKKQSTNGFEILNNYFFKDLQSQIVPSVSEGFTNDGSGKILGSELQAKYKKNEWSGQLVYTYLKSERTIPGFGTRPSEFDQTHNLNLIGSYVKGPWTYSARFRYVSGLPYTPITGATYDGDNDVFIPIPGTIYSERFDGFNQFDIRIDRKFIYDTWILTAYVDIQNVLNSSNSQNIQYSYDYSESEKVRGLPILPTFGLKGEF